MSKTIYCMLETLYGKCKGRCCHSCKAVYCEDRCKNDPSKCNLSCTEQVEGKKRKDTYKRSFNEGDLMEYIGQGLSDSEIAEEMGVTRNQVYYWRRTHRVESPLAARRAADRKEALRLYQQGLTCAEVAERIDCPHSTVWGWLKNGN